jgi:hypothetical protein
MSIRTIEQVLGDFPSYKSASLYNAAVKAIKSGTLRGKAIPLNRNDPNAKFRLQKAVTRVGRSAHREVTNYVILDMDAFMVWFDANKAGVRTTKALNRTQVTMPRLDDITSGQYTPEQLLGLAEHVASRRYGSHRTGGRAKKAAAAPKTGTGRRGRPKKNA